MRLSSLIASKPVFIFCLLATGVLLLPSIVVPWWYTTSRHINQSLDLNSYEFGSALLSQIDNTATLLDPINACAINLGRIVSSSFNGAVPSAYDLQRKVAPLLFHALALVPQVTHAAYVGLEGPFFSYYYEGNQTFAMYSQSTRFSNMTFKWYKQPVEPNTGKLQGNATESDPFVLANASWIQEAINSTNHGYASLTRAWNSGQDLLIMNTVSVHGQGVVSLGFPVQSLINFFTRIDLYGGSLYLATKNGDVLTGGLPNSTRVVVTSETAVSLQWVDLKVGNKSYVGEVSCMPGDGELRGSLMKIGETKYIVYCSPLEILGVPSVYVLALPYNRLVHTIDRSSRIALILLIVMITGVVISVLSFVLLMIRAASREMHLCSALINQMEATQQAERKSMNKSLAFATASHDIRSALAGITGLIDICYDDVSPGSQLETSLKQMDSCTKDLVGLLNSILDTSKIEAGKMQLEEEEFDLACLLEDVVDLYHPVGLKKGVDVVLDSCDGSILKFSRVKGDRGKLKQILCNLLSNAVKFTSEGHVSVRAWAQEPSLQSKIIASNQDNLWRHFSCLFCSKEELPNMETADAVKQNSSSMEFFFEVDDTGQGIPKEKQKSVFENFVQVKETGLGQGGTGLGLGIVQSLVRLMCGEIVIIDKENGTRGTCFRFNVFLSASATLATHNQQGDIETGGDSLADGTQRYSGLTIRTRTPSLTIHTTSPRLHMLSPRHRIDCSHVVLLIQDEERRRTTQKFMESLGIKVSAVKQWERLHPTLTKIKSQFNISHHNSAEKLDWGSRSDNTSTGCKDVPLNFMDGTEQNIPSYRSGSRKAAPSFVLLVIDAGSGPYRELCGAVTDFKRGLHRSSSKVVWLDKPTSRSIRTLDLDTDDEILLKPFHGSRLYQVIKLLPEFGGTMPQGLLSKSKKESKIETKKFYEHLFQDGKDVQAANYRPRNEKYRKKALSTNPIQAPITSQSALRLDGRPVSQSEIEEQHDNPNSDKPLMGMKFLVADDSKLLRMLTMTNLKKLGADVELCLNGQEALELVRIGLQSQREHVSSLVLPYDYILMDCEMPVMDGYEATRQIRREEMGFGIHIPIIALTAHISGGESEKMFEAGMDAHLGKPLEKEKLLRAIKKLQGK